MTFLPGIEMDAAVQEAIFHRIADDDVPQFSTNGAWADILVRRMRTLGWTYEVERGGEGSRFWRVRFSLEGSSSGEFESASREVAICVAALKAVGREDSTSSPGPWSRPWAPEE